MFHTLKFGFLKDLNAGVLMLLCEMKYLDSPGDSWSMDSRLDRAFGLFKLWQAVSQKSSGLRKFSKLSFHRDKATKYPFMSGKGSDSVVVLEFLEWLLRLKLRSPKEPRHTQIFVCDAGGRARSLIFHRSVPFALHLFLSSLCEILSQIRASPFERICVLADMCIGEKSGIFP